MQILRHVNNISSRTPVILTIGNFDGVHLGHQSMLSVLTARALQNDTQSVAITFANHPSTVLRPDQPVTLLCTPQHKLLLLEKAGIDLTILLDFTLEFSKQSAGSFLESLQQNIPFSHLILGNDAHIGKDREAGIETISALQKKMNFKLEIFPDYLIDGIRITSSKIRETILSGSLSLASKYLGRPYSIYSTISTKEGSHSTAVSRIMNVQNLCLPPPGTYPITIRINEKVSTGQALISAASSHMEIQFHPNTEVKLSTHAEVIFKEC